MDSLTPTLLSPFILSVAESKDAWRNGILRSS